MHDQRRDSVPGQPAVRPSNPQRADDSPARHGMALPNLPDFRSTTISGSSWPEGSSLVSPHDLPPHYDLHQFPPTPPALQSPDPQRGSYFDQSHHGAPPHASPSADAAYSSSQQPPRAFASRFPRWGSWLEKRALERHYAQLDRQALVQHDASDRADAAPSRKKSWGAWIHDPDAINDDDLLDATPARQARAPDAAPLPPLHLHHFGSRFIPHLPAQPLCSILVELPSANSNHLAPPFGPHPVSSRQVLLVGTAQGLFAVQLRPAQPQASRPQAAAEAGASSPLPNRQWNQNIRCIPIWTGLAVYQMSVLASNEATASAHAPTLNSTKLPTSGVFLALTCPSSARDGFLTSSLMQLSAHAGSILESVAASGISSSSSSSSHNSHGLSDTHEGVASANFGSTAGGGSGRAVPPGGTGVVRMWHLEAIRELLIYALDRSDAQTPIDLSASAGQVDKRAGLGSILKKTFSKPKSKSERKAVSTNRSMSSGSLAATVRPLAPYCEAEPSSTISAPAPSSEAASNSENRFGDEASFSRHDPGRASNAPQKSPPSTKRQLDPAHAAAVALANGSVPIQPSSQSNAGSQGYNASMSSLFAEDLISTFTGNRQASSKGKEREAGLQAASKGVLFFSVHEAAADTKGAGTWYLAITYARSVLVYEASVPKHGSTRAWSFLKELYAPFPIKAVAFAPAAVPDTMHPFTALDSLSANAGPTKLRVASADGPLSTSKKGRQIDQGHSAGVSRENSMAGPVHMRRGSAAPASWHKADLCLLLSFGRRAVLVRLRDSHVREMDLKPLSQLLSASNPSAQVSLPPQPRAGLGDAHSRYERSRPLSLSGEDGQRIDSQPSPGSGHNRTASLEQRFKDAILDKRSNKHNWIGFSSIEAQILVRQWPVQSSEGVHALRLGSHLERGNSSLSPVGLSMSRNVYRAADSSLAGVDKELPRVPAHQNASFDRRMSRLHLSEQSLQDHDYLQGEASSDSDEEDEEDETVVDTRVRAAAYQLTDPGPQPHGRRRRPGQGVSQKRSFSLPPAELVSVKLALASRGSVTHIIPLPLPADLAQTNPLAVMQWSDTPNAVSGWARVLGVERASSKGPTPLSHLKQSSTASTASDQGWFHADAWAAHHTPGFTPAPETRRRSNRLVLHVGVTCVAFLASRIEARKVTVKLRVEVDFRIVADSELELIGVAPNTEYNRANGTPDTSIDTPSADQETVTPHEDHQDDATSLGEGSQAPLSRLTFAYPPPAAHLSDDSVPVSRTEANALSQELEYLCAPLLTLHPMDLNPPSSGSQSLILPYSQGAKADSTASAAHSLFADLAGDAGIVAFDWRGADDFRIFTVGIAG